jgi:hypothetical protein
VLNRYFIPDKIADSIHCVEMDLLSIPNTISIIAFARNSFAVDFRQISVGVMDGIDQLVVFPYSASVTKDSIDLFLLSCYF